VKYRFRPLCERVVLRKIEIKEQNVGGIIIPDVNREETYMGVVVALDGEAAEHLKVGDVVAYENYGCTEINLNGEKLLVNKLEGIIGVMEEDHE
jgi:chaperonin GroES